MRPLEYRLPRAVTAFDIEFLVDGMTLHGRCRDLSEEGIRAEFEGKVEAGHTGLLTLRHSARVLRIDARSTHAEESQVGLSFIFETPEQRAAATRFAALVNAKS